MKKGNKQYPKYSVLMSVYSKETRENLRKSIDSALNQTILCDEFVLVEDGPLSRELNSLISEYIKKYKNIIRIIKLEKNLGLGLALNRGISECKNELIARFDSDDISVADRCEKQLNEFINDKNLDIVGSNHIEFVGDISNTKSYLFKRLPITNGDIAKYARKRNPFSHSAIMYKKSKVILAGNYKNYYFVEDYDLWVRMIKDGCKCKNINEYLNYVRVSDDLYKRRGGVKYLKSILRFKWEMYKKGFSSFADYFISSASSVMVCLMPIFLRNVVYKKLLRK